MPQSTGQSNDSKAKPTPKVDAKTRRTKNNRSDKPVMLCPEPFCPEWIREDDLIRHLAWHKGLGRPSATADSTGRMRKGHLRNDLRKGKARAQLESLGAVQAARQTPPTWKSSYWPKSQQLEPRPRRAPLQSAVQATATVPHPGAAVSQASSNQYKEGRCEKCGRIMPASYIPHHLKEDCTGRVGAEARLPFRLLPPGAWGIDQILEYFRTEQQGWLAGRTVDEERLRRIERLNPRQRILGTTGYKGYVLFVLAWWSAVVLESPVERNATYILWDDWRGMLQLTKSELCLRPNCRRTIHTARSFSRVIAELEAHRTLPVPEMQT